MAARSGREAIGPGVVRQRCVDEPAADERYDAIGHADISFTRRERPIEDHDGTKTRGHRPSADEYAVAEMALVMVRRR